MQEITTDFAVIGAGVSGAFAARELSKSHKTVLIEENLRCGGRVFSPVLGEHRCELGATVGYNSEKLPIDLPASPLIHEPGNMAVRFKGDMFVARTPEDCLTEMERRGAIAASPSLAAQISAAEKDNAARHLIEDSHDFRIILQGLFNVMNPGSVFGYAPAVWPFALHRFHPSHRKNGNIEIIEHLLGDLNVLNGNRVDRIIRKDRGYELIGSGFKCEAQGVVIATDAAIASSLTHEINPIASDLLSQIGYGSFVAHAQEVSGAIANDPVSYLVDTDSQTTICAQLHTSDPQITHQLTLFSGLCATKVLEFSDTEIAALSRRAWEGFPGRVEGRHINEKTARWPRAGTIVDEDFASRITKIDQALDDDLSIQVVGDYMIAPHYGIQAAAASGMQASDALKNAFSGI